MHRHVPDTLLADGLRLGPDVEARALPFHVDIILADADDRRLVAGIGHLRAPVEEIAALPVTPSRVLVVENKESAPPVEGAAGVVIVHFLGNWHAGKETCAQARGRYIREYHQRRLDGIGKPVQHGTPTGYLCGCRGSDCPGGRLVSLALGRWSSIGACAGKPEGTISRAPASRP